MPKLCKRPPRKPYSGLFSGNKTNTQIHGRTTGVSTAPVKKRSGLAHEEKRRPTHFWATFVKFGGLSGLGWIVDFIILLSLVKIIGLTAAEANFISSSIASMMVFTISRATIFTKADGGFFFRLVAYFGYVACVIVVSSLAIYCLVSELSKLIEYYGLHPEYTTVTAAAKVLVHPLPLYLISSCLAF